jgi:hypothetical protein
VRVLRIHLLTPKRITGLFLYVFHHVFFVHSEVTGVSCIKYIGECFASTPSTLIGVREFFFMVSVCFVFSRKIQVHGTNIVVKFA